jgi:hypothetical protein
MPVDVLTRIEIRRPSDGVTAFAQDPDRTSDGYETSARWSGRRPRRSPWAAAAPLWLASSYIVGHRGDPAQPRRAQLLFGAGVPLDGDAAGR